MALKKIRFEKAGGGKEGGERETEKFGNHQLLSESKEERSRNNR
jgi:hypothetical protein